MNKLISIIVPVYNNQDVLKICIESILSQTYKNIQLILINDGSTDNTKEICEWYREKDSRITVIHQENHGVSFSRNIGLDNATGKYITFVDSDDKIDSTYVEKMINKLDAGKNELVICEYADVDYTGEIIEQHVNKELTGDLKKDYCKVHFSGPFLAGMLGKIYVLDIIKKYHIRFDETMDYCEDSVFNNTYFLYVNKYEFIDECLYYYVHNNMNSLSRRLRVEMLDSIRKMILHLSDVCDKKCIEQKGIIIADQFVNMITIAGQLLSYNEFKLFIENNKMLLNECYQSPRKKRMLVLQCIKYHLYGIIYWYYSRKRR